MAACQSTKVHVRGRARGRSMAKWKLLCVIAFWRPLTPEQLYFAMQYSCVPSPSTPDLPALAFCTCLLLFNSCVRQFWSDHLKPTQWSVLQSLNSSSTSSNSIFWISQIFLKFGLWPFNDLLRVCAYPLLGFYMSSIFYWCLEELAFVKRQF